jgi:hypothetical protein
MKVRVSEKKLVEMIERVINEDLPIMSKKEVKIDMLADRIVNKLEELSDYYGEDLALEVLDRAKQRLIQRNGKM